MNILAIVLIILGLINIVRMAIFFIGGQLYDIQMLKKTLTSSNKKRRPLISIVIAAYNEEKTIERSLQSIACSSYNKYEIIVVDDGSTDATATIAKLFADSHPHHPIQVLSQTNSGKAHALNNGIQHAAKGTLIMTLDADSIIDRYALEHVVKYFQDRSVMAVASNVKIIPNKSLLSLIQRVEYLMGYQLKKAYTVTNMEYIIGGIGSTFRKNILKYVHFYDTDTITEDIDLTLKIINRGNKKNKVIYGADVIAYTEAVPTVTQLYKQRLRWKLGRFQSLYKTKQLFFNTNKKYSKLLTFFQLPFVLYSEVTFLFDPLFIFLVYYYMMRYGDFSSMQNMILFLMFYTIVCIAADQHSTIKDKILLILTAPLAYIFFLLISIVEYVGLLKCIADYKRIFYATELKECGWVHVDRIGN